jgi:ATP-dependent DNA helicase RecG
LQDDTAAIELVWYRAPAFLLGGLADRQTLWVHGKVEQGTHARFRLAHPAFEVIDSEASAQVRRVMPVYVHPNGLSLSLMRRWIAQALAQYSEQIPSRLPPEIRERQGLISIADALGELHAPPLDADLNVLNAGSSAAHRTIIFDELFYMQLGLGLRRKSRTHAAVPAMRPVAGALSTRMAELLPFKLTGAQQRVLGEIATDMASEHPMQRLVQGDVGSGKTMVAWFASLRAIENGRQALWMAPTEILAEQHYHYLKQFADDLRISSALLTATTPVKEKRELLHAIEGGDVAFIVGTHALIQQEVRAPGMGLGVIDEQHRFGVMQRLSLQRLVEDGGGTQARQPHILLMSATPIPRSLAMVLYGDMEVSFVDELPPGRTPVQTKVYGERERRRGLLARS